MQKNVLKKSFQSHKWDLLLGAALLLIALCLFFVLKNNKKEGAYVEVTQNNKIVGKYSLSEDAEYEYKTFYGSNTLVIKDGMAYVKDSTCRDHICEKMGKIHIEGDMVICLPNELFVKIVGKKGGSYDAISK